MTYTDEEVQEHRAQWLAELRSGRRQQVQGVLRRDDRFCCLGVAEDLAGTQCRSVEGLYAYRMRESEPAFTQKTALTTYGQAWLGVDNEDPYVDMPTDRGGDYLTLATLNDSGCTFEQIAQLIEHFGLIDHPYSGGAAFPETWEGDQ